MIKKLFPIFCVVLLSACGGKKEFNVAVDVAAVGTQAMTVVYATETGERVILRVPAIDGKFEFKGVSSDTTSVEVFNAKKTLFVTFCAVNGMDLTIKAKGDSLYADGADVSVYKTIDAVTPDSLPMFAGLELVVGYDTIASFKPEGVWFFTSTTMERTKPVLDSMRKYAGIDSVEVRDVYVSADMSQWRMFTARDSATWTQGMLPDAPIALRGILTSTPCFVEVDSAGIVMRVQRLE